MKIDTHAFFRLPLEEKRAYAQLPDNIEGYGQAFVLSEEQKLDWGDMLFFLTLPVHSRDMRFRPTSPTSFRSRKEGTGFPLNPFPVVSLSMLAIQLR
ncbi:hypothetical protein IFM89_027667 [Coptis chinensis]|uniref:Non-haem dioxygenase N-terminal domain-containing protein n=1 Tax=Coptis chinensis TaxID=261450 RepID=A0A835IY22_9MAGN|nr:hypothetical protein IFM89_027667 [Coptis chinensis]